MAAGNWTELEVGDGSRMRTYTCGTGACGAIILQEAFGVNAHIQDVADRLAGEGYRCIAPELYHRTAPEFVGDYSDFRTAMPHLNAMRDEGQDQDLRACAAWLAEHNVSEMVAVGFCMGGRVAIRAAAALELRAAASFYGGRLPSLRERIAAISAPLLLVWGDKDEHIPPSQRAEFADLLRAQGKDFVECTFSAADHGFFCDARPSYHARSARLAWSLLISFLREPLRATSA
ncbi:MAG TPA: dienelactone hydrolase family protein [Terriglobales bacterium]|nr:dienelactone hydrolase family protein [Terriglobales bacterium]